MWHYLVRPEISQIGVHIGEVDALVAALRAAPTLEQPNALGVPRGHRDQVRWGGLSEALPGGRGLSYELRRATGEPTRCMVSRG